MDQSSKQVWYTCGYVRLSREDGDKEESNSVTGQKCLIRDYLSCHPEFQECSMKVDDGYTGSTFDRPAFQEMMAEVKAGKINCIVVKDLSRFGRNYLEAGEYIERIFPFLGVRFIAINDHYDSLHRNPGSDDLLIPFKNLLNEALCRETSTKIRSLFEIKRQNGDFIGAFPAFGYQKDPNNHNHLLIDDYATDVVRDIFQWKLEGISSVDIAKRLNQNNIPTLMDYKRSQGLKYSTSFRTKEESLWSAGTVLRILKNPIYIGVLEQGRVTTPSYKDKRLVYKPREEWAVVEKCHEAIIDRYDFEIVQKVLALDTRTGVSGQAVGLFSGMVYCGECGSAMIQRSVPSGRKKYVYYICSARKERKTCFTHSMRIETLEEIVLEALKKHIQDVIDLSDLLELIDTAQLQQASTQRLQTRLKKEQAEIDRCQMLLSSLYENLIDGVIDRKKYQYFGKTYSDCCAEAKARADAIQEKMDREQETFSAGREWMERFRRHRNIDSLDRVIVVSLIERILIYRDHRVEITYRWQDEFQWQMDLLSQAQKLPSGKELA